MENEKMSGQPTETQNESDISKETKVDEQVKSSDQPVEQESDATQMGNENKDQSESTDELAPEVSSEPEAKQEPETASEPEVSSEESTVYPDSEAEESAEAFYQDIRQKAEEFVLEPDWAYVSNELANLALKMSEGPEPDTEGAKQAIAAFQTLRDEFEARKKAYYEELNQKSADNLERKKKILKQLSGLIRLRIGLLQRKLDLFSNNGNRSNYFRHQK